MPCDPRPGPPCAPPARPTRGRLLALLAGLALLLVAMPAEAFRIVEFNLGCANGDRAPMWVQIDGLDFELMDGALGVQTFDRDGVLLQERRRIFGARTGSAWFPGERWFFGTSACVEAYTDFDNATAFPPDAAMLVPMDTLAGRIVLFRLEGTTRVPLQEVRYGPGGDIDAPPPGSSAMLLAGSWRWNPAPIARRYDGYSYSGSPCLGYPRFAIRELMLACEDGDPRGGFLELEALGVRPAYDARIHLRAYDRDGALIAEVTDLFGARAGEGCATGSRWLLAGEAFAAAASGAPDHVLPVALDPVAGRLELSGTILGTFWLIDTLSYDRASGARPPDGLAIEHAPLSRLVHVVAPTPTTSTGDTLRLPGCAFGTRPPAPFLQELALRCADGGLDGQFIELAARDGEVALTGSWSVRAFDRTGALSFSLPLETGPPLVLSPLAGYLIATDAPLVWGPEPPDARLPAPLDPVGGRVELVTPGIAGDSVVSVIGWGGASNPVPPAGTSLASNGRSRIAAQPFPTPAGRDGRTRSAGNCLAGAGGHAYVVSEVGTHCQDGSPDGLFVELASDSLDDTYDPALGLRLRSPAGVTLATCFPLFANAPRGPRPPGRTWLIGAPGFEARNGLTPDAVLDGAPDASTASISVFRRDLVTGADSTLHTMSVGSAPPADGRSIVRAPDRRYVASGVVTPTRSDGAVVAPGACYVRARPEAVRIGEVFLRCRDGDPSARFVELVAASGDASYAPDLTLRIFDHLSRLTGTITHPFAALEGQPWSAGRPFMLGGEGVEARLGLTPDAPLPFALDTLGGRLQLLLAGGEGGLPVDEVRWGSAELPAPVDGSSLEREGESWREASLPTPATRERDGERLLSCLGVCPPRTVRMAFGAAQLLTEARASLSSFEASAELDATRGAWSIEAGFDETRARLPDRFTLIDETRPGPVTLRARLDWVGHASTACDSLGACSGSQVSVALRIAGQLDSATAVGDSSGSVTLAFAATPGEPFELVSEGRATGDLSRGFRARVTARLVFETPAGARVVSCYGYDSRLARGAGEARVITSAGDVRIEWPVLEPATFVGTVERRERDRDWIAIETRTADADGFVRFGDRRAAAGATYEYRLVWDDLFGHEETLPVTVRVPARATFALLGARPHPARGSLQVAIELAEPGEARLELLDVTGRLVTRQVRSFAAGPHVVPLAARLAPGVYVVRLQASGRDARTTVVVY